MAENKLQLVDEHGNPLVMPQTDLWGKLRSISTIVAATLIPLVIAFIGNAYTNSIKQKEREAKFVELAVAILSQPPAEENRKIRGWAIRVIDTYSDVKFTEEEKEDLIENVPLGSTAMRCGNHDPVHIATSYAERKTLTDKHGCKDWHPLPRSKIGIYPFS